MSEESSHNNESNISNYSEEMAPPPPRNSRISKTIQRLENEDKLFTKQRRKKINSSDLDYMSSEDELSQEHLEEFEKEIDYESLPNIFKPFVEKIISRKIQDNKNLYYVKFKLFSYYHCKWVDEEYLKNANNCPMNKLKMFNNKFDLMLQNGDIWDIDNDNDFELIESNLLEIDKILNSTNIFSIIHPKKSSEIKGKYIESCLIVNQLLLNYQEGNIFFGINLNQSVESIYNEIHNENIEELTPNLITINNRIYLDYYKTFNKFWTDIGIIFINFEKIFEDIPDFLDIKIIVKKLKLLIIVIYKKWYDFQKNKYMSLKNDLETNLVKIIEDIKNNKELLEYKNKIDLFLNDLSINFNNFKEIENNLENINMYQNKILELLVKYESIFLKLNYSNIIRNLFDKVYNNPNNNEYINNLILQVENKIKKDFETLIEEKEATIKYNLMKENNFYDEFYIEKFNPLEYSYEWLNLTIDESDEILNNNNKEFEEYISFDSLIDPIYLIKWKNQSYINATWENKSIIPEKKIVLFKTYNKALIKNMRNLVSENLKNHVTLKGYLSKKYSYTPNFKIKELKNKLFRLNKNPIPYEYNLENQPLYKEERRLKDYQIESLNWLIKNWADNRNCILADEMGLGKTIQSISFLNHLVTIENMKGPFLIICPLSTIGHWNNSIEDWTNISFISYYDIGGKEGRQAIIDYEWFYNEVTLKGIFTKKSEILKFDIILTTFDVFQKDFEIFSNLPIQHIIIDEAHRLKNQESKLLNLLKQLICKKILLLTGTPIQNNTKELFTLLNYIEPNKFPSFIDFINNFGDIKDEGQINKLNNLLKPFILRRKKEHVEQSIPPLNETIIDVELTNYQKAVYKTLYEKNKGILSEGDGLSYIRTLNNLQIQLRKCCNHPFLIDSVEKDIVKDDISKQEFNNILLEYSGKMILLNQLIDKYIKDGLKILIFSQFTKMLDWIEEYIKFNNFKYEKIDGSVNSRERQNAIDRFNDNKIKRDIFLLSTKAGGLGINLTSANIVIIFDSDWNPQNDVQATARAHRIGQTNEVKVFRLITKGTYESVMFERASKKLGLDHVIFMNGGYNMTKYNIVNRNKNEIDKFKKLDKEEIEILLKKGWVGLINEQNQENNNINNKEYNINDIEKIINNSNAISNVNGNYNLSKTTFSSVHKDSKIDIDDPQFWKKIFKNEPSEVDILNKELDELVTAGEMKNIETQKEYLIKISDYIINLIDKNIKSNVNIQEDEEKVKKLCLKIINSYKKIFKKKVLNLFIKLMDMLSKKNRRSKRITKENIDEYLDREINKKKINQVKDQNSKENSKIIFDEDYDDSDEIVKKRRNPKSKKKVETEVEKKKISKKIK